MRARARHPAVRSACLGLLAAILLVAPEKSSAQTGNHRQFFDRYCVSCHNERLKSGGLSLASADTTSPGATPQVWEKIVRKLRTGVMPPPSATQPAEADRHAILTWLETSLDAASASRPDPGRPETLRRLNRTEYQNSIRDLLALEIDAAALLPPDQRGYGFDNVHGGDLPPAVQ